MRGLVGEHHPAAQVVEFLVGVGVDDHAVRGRGRRDARLTGGDRRDPRIAGRVVAAHQLRHPLDRVRRLHHDLPGPLPLPGVGDRGHRPVDPAREVLQPGQMRGPAEDQAVPAADQSHRALVPQLAGAALARRRAIGVGGDQPAAVAPGQGEVLDSVHRRAVVALEAVAQPYLGGQPHVGFSGPEREGPGRVEVVVPVGQRHACQMGEHRALTVPVAGGPRVDGGEEARRVPPLDGLRTGVEHPLDVREAGRCGGLGRTAGHRGEQGEEQGGTARRRGPRRPPSRPLV